MAATTAATEDLFETGDSLDMTTTPPIVNLPTFYKDSSIFITGITGFLGKSILEKLLRSCPEVRHIYVLVRTKKGQAPAERVDALFDSKLFDKVQIENPDAKEKVVAIAGDMLEENLGISPEDERRLVEAEVSIVIHSAATIRFDEPLRLALMLNVAGTQKVVRLCHKLPKLRSLVHVSTAYANCDLKHIQEQVYPPPVDPHKLLDALEWMTDEAATKLTPVLLGNKPNTYTYTKHLAESLLIKEAGAANLPFVIVRPSIVGASWKEPFPGWIDNFNGPSGLFIACGMGLLRSMIGNPEAVADIVPVDIVSNVIIAAPWYNCIVRANAGKSADSHPNLSLTLNPFNPKATYNPTQTPTSIPASTTTATAYPAPFVVNCTSGQINSPLTWGGMAPSVLATYYRFPMQKAFRYPNCNITNNRMMYFLWVFTCHRLPAFFVDTYMRMVGRKPRMLSMYRKLHRSMETLCFFTQRHWEWEVQSLVHLQSALDKYPSDAPNSEFTVNVENIDWPSYLENFCVGTKCYVLNEEMSELHIAKRRMSRLKTLHYVFNIFTAAVVWRLIALKSEVASKMWNMLVKFILKWLDAMRLTRFITL